MIFNKKIKSSNYTLETINKRSIFLVFPLSEDEKKKFLKKQIEFIMLKK